jgi:hypothetical protein
MRLATEHTLWDIERVIVGQEHKITNGFVRQVCFVSKNGDVHNIRVFTDAPTTVVNSTSMFPELELVKGMK